MPKKPIKKQIKPSIKKSIKAKNINKNKLNVKIHIDNSKKTKTASKNASTPAYRTPSNIIYYQLPPQYINSYVEPIKQMPAISESTPPKKELLKIPVRGEEAEREIELPSESDLIPVENDELDEYIKPKLSKLR